HQQRYRDFLIETQLHLKPTSSHYLSNLIRKEHPTMQNRVESTPVLPTDVTKEGALAYYYTTAKAFEKIQSSGRLKSRALLISKELRSRPDSDVIKNDRHAMIQVLPPYATSIRNSRTNQPSGLRATNSGNRKLRIL